MTGSGLAQTVTSAVPARPCGKFGQGFVVDLRFPMLGTTYAISIVIDRYTGPGVYGAPPVRVSAHTLGLSQTPAFYAGVSGTVSVAPNESSGTVDESLLRSPDRYQLTGSWHCG
ncbi:MAG: hypothetical protein ACREPA_06790 [Candidatus Dormibacteraceae bacterium]